MISALTGLELVVLGGLLVYWFLFSGRMEIFSREKGRNSVTLRHKKLKMYQVSTWHNSIKLLI